VKKFYVALMAAGVTFSASAFAFEGSIVKVPASNDHFFVGVEALWLQASDTNGDLDYANLNVPPVSTGATNNSIQNIDPTYQWAWRIFAGWEYGAAMDVSLSYFNLRNSDSDSVGVSPTGTAGVFPQNDPTAFGSYTDGSANVDTHIDQVDLTFGQKIRPIRCVTLHPFGGLRYARITRDLDASFTDGTLGTTTVFDLDTSDDSKFSGVGPIAGLDAMIDLGSGFKVVGHVDAGVMVGDMDDDFSSVRTATTTGGVVTTAETNVDADSNTRVVPFIDTRLGVSYTYEMDNDSALILELGYQASVYHDAIDKISVGSGSGTTFAGGGTPENPVRNTSSLGLNGPYLNLVWRI